MSCERRKVVAKNNEINLFNIYVLLLDESISGYELEKEVGNNVRSRAGKYGLSDVIMYGAFAATADGESYKASTFYRLSNKSTIGIMEYSEKERRYVPIKTDAYSLPEKFAISKELEEIFENDGAETIFMNIFYLQMYTDIPEFRKKVDEYNKKYPEDRIFFNE